MVEAAARRGAEGELVMAPKRIQLSRKKGWRMPPNTVIVSRPSKWGNPFEWREAMYELGCTEQEAKQWAKETYLELAMLALSDQPRRPTSIIGCETEKTFIRENLGSLAGKNIACWCPLDKPCHADILLELANR